MRKIILISFLLYFSSLLVINAQPDTSKTKILSVVVMPFLDDQNYPYNLDMIRESFVRAFYQKGFAVVMDDSTWSIILDQDVNPTKFLKDDALTLSENISVDLIVFGQISINQSKQRGDFNTPNPVSVSIFDTRKKELVVKERMEPRERWGLMWRYFSFDDMALRVVNQLIAMGYK
ncbi:MAG: hypothetical protein GYA14_09055 [Ignavibacteria bacterium]|nr:hypothetical protein [Ignavibacteria bacterium]